MRFITELQLDKSYMVIDTDNLKYRMPRHAVTLHFKFNMDAQHIANELNKEWRRFQANPE